MHNTPFSMQNTPGLRVGQHKNQGMLLRADTSSVGLRKCCGLLPRCPACNRSAGSGSPSALPTHGGMKRGPEKRNSRSLHFGRDDNSVAGLELCPGSRVAGITELSSRPKWRDLLFSFRLCAPTPCRKFAASLLMSLRKSLIMQTFSVNAGLSVNFIDHPSMPLHCQGSNHFPLTGDYDASDRPPVLDW
jgi:hypothetical protein